MWWPCAFTVCVRTTDTRTAHLLHTHTHALHNIHTYTPNETSTHTPKTKSENPHTHTPKTKQRRLHLRSKNQKKKNATLRCYQKKKTAVNRADEIRTFATIHRTSTKKKHLSEGGSFSCLGSASNSTSPISGLSEPMCPVLHTLPLRPPCWTWS